MGNISQLQHSVELNLSQSNVGSVYFAAKMAAAKGLVETRMEVNVSKR